jgi:hypothetical protein
VDLKIFLNPPQSPHGVDLVKILNPPHMPHGVDLSSPLILITKYLYYAEAKSLILNSNYLPITHCHDALIDPFSNTLDKLV